MKKQVCAANDCLLIYEHQSLRKVAHFPYAHRQLKLKEWEDHFPI